MSFVLSIGTTGTLSNGLPQFISILSSEPATIYYNFDNEEVSISNGYVYTNPIEITDNTIRAITIHCFGITYDGDVSETLTKTFTESTETTGYLFNRRGPRDNNAPVHYGNIVDEYPLGDGTSNAIDADGNYVGYQDLENSDYSIVQFDSEVVIITRTLPERSTSQIDENFGSSSNLSDRLFNPKASVIRIDSDNPNNQPISIIMRDRMSMRNQRDDWDGAGFNSISDEGAYISGSLIRRCVGNGRMASYYFDFACLKWVIVERELEQGEFNINLNQVSGHKRNKNTNGLVFSWWSYPGRGNMR